MPTWKLEGKVFMGLFKKYRWFKNGDGQEDAVLTMAWVGFLVVVFRVLVSGLEIHIWKQDLKFSTIDAGTIASILTPTLGAYVAHQYNSMKNNPYYIKMKKDIDGDGKEEDVVVTPDPDGNKGK